MREGGGGREEGWEREEVNGAKTYQQMESHSCSSALPGSIHGGPC